MPHESPYLKADRLGDVIAALQFLGQYTDYKLSVDQWSEKIATAPRSAGDKPCWGTIFDEHPEFFRRNDEGLVSLIWRRAIEKTQATGRAPLQPETIARLIDTAVGLYSTAVEAKRADEAKQLQAIQDRRWKIQLGVSVLTACLAFLGAVLAAWLKASGGSG
jgi:hypothetical protein